MKTKKMIACAFLSAGLMLSAQAQNWNGGGFPNLDLWRDGNVGIGMFGPPNPAYKLELDQGDFNILNGFGIRFDGTYGLRLVSPGSNDFLLGDGGNIGIGMSPSFPLDVNGIGRINGDFLLGGDAIFNSDFTLAGDAVLGGNLVVNGNQVIGSDLDVNGILRVGGTDAITNVGGHFVLGNGNSFGIGTTPAYKLDVDGDINYPMSAYLRIGGIGFMRYHPATNLTTIGHNAGVNNTTGLDNVFFGRSAGRYNTTGHSNTHLGNHAGENNTTGIFNTTVGCGTGTLDPSGSFNTYTGSGAAHGLVGSWNCAYGANALHNGRNAGGNCAFGDYAGAYVAPGSVGTGSNNTFMGSSAGLNNSMGSENVYIGFHSAANLQDNTRNTFVGAVTSANGEDNVLLGYRSTGIGSVRIAGAIGSNAEVAADNTLALGGTAGSGYATTVVIGQNTPVGLFGGTIGTSMGFSALEVNGDILSQGALWFNSDKRFKKDIKDIGSAGDLLRKLHPVTYNYRDDMYFNEVKGSDQKVNMNLPKGEQIGFLAQELEEVMPDAVKTRTDGYKAVNYNHFFGLLVKGYQEHDETIENELKKSDRMQTEIDMIKEQNRLLLEMIEELKAAKNDQASATDSKTKTAYLEQNSPNPFNENTVLKYFVPENTTGAKVVIRSSDAIEVMSFDVVHKGHGNIIVSGNSLTTGTYTCELYIGSKMVDMKRMLLVK